jgi:predicted transcriptional regulator
LPDKLTEIFSLKKNPNSSKTTQNKYQVQACIKHWLEGNSIKCYNKSGCLLRVETTINKPGLPGLKLKKPACNLQAYYWYGHACNSRYLTTLADIDISTLSTEDFEKYQQSIITEKGVRIAAPDLRNKEQLELYSVLLSANYFSIGFKNKDLQRLLGENWKTAKIAYELRKLRERGAIKKIKNSHYYRLTEEGMNWLFYSFFNLLHFVNPLLSKQIKSKQKSIANNPSAIEQAYSMIEQHRRIIMNELGIVA